MDNKIKLPPVKYKITVCPVCGSSYDFHGHKPRTCKDFNCRYAYDNKVNVHEWAHIPRSMVSIANRQADND